jgi:hypothetical protein
MKQAFYPILIKGTLSLRPVFCLHPQQIWCCISRVSSLPNIDFVQVDMRVKKEPALREGRLYSFNN